MLDSVVVRIEIRRQYQPPKILTMKNDIIPFYQPSERVLVESKACYQYDSEGKKYIDFESGVWCANLGHSPERICEVMQKQAQKAIHHGYYFRNQLAEDLSLRLQEKAGFQNGASVFLSSGSEAVNLSINIARKLSKRKKILKIDNSYLSAFGFGQITAENEDLQCVKFNDLSACEEIDFSEIAAFLIETGGASLDAVRIPDQQFISRLVQKSKEHGCLLIAEEVTTGMGRMGQWFGFQNYELMPDLLVAGKALGNGYPISAVVLSEEVSLQLNEQIFRYAQSHQNDPLGCAIALEVIQMMEEEDLIDKARETGAFFQNKLQDLCFHYPDKVKEVRGKAMMLALEFTEAYDGEKLSQYLLEKGFLHGFKQNSLRFLPPLVIGQDDIENLIHTIKEALIQIG